MTLTILATKDHEQFNPLEFSFVEFCIAKLKWKKKKTPPHLLITSIYLCQTQLNESTIYCSASLFFIIYLYNKHVQRLPYPGSLQCGRDRKRHMFVTLKEGDLIQTGKSHGEAFREWTYRFLESWPCREEAVTRGQQTPGVGSLCLVPETVHWVWPLYRKRLRRLSSLVPTNRRWLFKFNSCKLIAIKT